MKFPGTLLQWRVILRDVLAIAWLVLGLTMAVSLVSHDCLAPCSNVYSHQRIANLAGSIGAEMSSWALQWCGMGAWMIPVLCIGCFVRLAQQRSVWPWIFFGSIASVFITLVCPRTWSVQPPALLLVSELWLPQWFYWGCVIIIGAWQVMLRTSQWTSRSSAQRPPLPPIVQPDTPRPHKPVSMEVSLPPLTLLKDYPNPRGDKKKELHIDKLQAILEDFGVKGTVLRANPGPIVTLYELEPAAGVKSSRVISLADDIARSMSALSARVAVIAGKNLIGIELSNHHRDMVYLKELLAEPEYHASDASLALTLGKDISGQPVVADLAKMPHMLVAGTTGSGKSVGINSMILSLLYRLSPAQCKLVMIDPKMLELSVYDGIPHLLTPVITEPKKAIMALKWVVQEMENRYRLMSQLGVRHIGGYNQRVKQAAQSKTPITRHVHVGFDEESEPVMETQVIEAEPMPFIVVVVDEMADLMMVAGKDLEVLVQRLAQMARAAGIHLIMATQRPSVDVITGTIKANFPTRISFQVTSKIDSRTILGEQGAEHLLGQGDMLFVTAGGRITRVHGPFVSDQEIEKVVEFLQASGEPNYVSMTLNDEEGLSSSAGSDGSDQVYQQAIDIVRMDRKTSISYIQRRLQIGYNRAARLIEQMEKDGIISPANHLGKREIL